MPAATSCRWVFHRVDRLDPRPEPMTTAIQRSTTLESTSLTPEHSNSSSRCRAASVSMRWIRKPDSFRTPPGRLLYGLAGLRLAITRPAPVAQGIEHRPPEAGAQVRILPGAPSHRPLTRGNVLSITARATSMQ